MPKTLALLTIHGTGNTRRLALVLALSLAVPACGGQPEAATAKPLTEYRAFGAPQRVTIRGYEGDAMEPFIARDGRFLLFNNRNDPRIDTRLLYAERIDDLTFDFRGEIAGVNTPTLEGVPSLDRHGNLYFVSTRSYGETLSTLYRGRFGPGRAAPPGLVRGVSLQQAGSLTFDAEISADGDSLYLAEGRFTGGPIPERADLDLALREGDAFRRTAGAKEIFRNINTPALEYAPALSADQLELFFTRFSPRWTPAAPVILRAARERVDAPFGLPQRVAAIEGHVEAPTLTADGRALYYHKLEAGRFVLFRVGR